MAMDPLPPIPTPAHQRWREFKIQVLPVVIFAITISMVVFLWRTYVLPANLVGMVETNSVAITTAEPGVITEMFVSQFEEVTNAQPLCVIRPFSPELTRAALDKVAADLNVLRSRLSLRDRFRCTFSNHGRHTHKIVILFKRQSVLVFINLQREKVVGKIILFHKVHCRCYHVRHRRS